MKAVLYKFCGKTILQVGPISQMIASRAKEVQVLEFDTIHIEMPKEEQS